ncbi:unnamed protein product [Boreogadus saida]
MLPVVSRGERLWRACTAHIQQTEPEDVHFVTLIGEMENACGGGTRRKRRPFKRRCHLSLKRGREELTEPFPGHLLRRTHTPAKARPRPWSGSPTGSTSLSRRERIIDPMAHGVIA